jgi:hypothetical protein
MHQAEHEAPPTAEPPQVKVECENSMNHPVAKNVLLMGSSFWRRRKAEGEDAAKCQAPNNQTKKRL